MRKQSQFTKMSLHLFIGLTVSALALHGAQAQAAETRTMAAHEHGVGTLMLVVEGEEVVLAFESPAMDIVGFESGPLDKEQLIAVNAAVVTLSDPMTLLDINDLDCVVTKADVLVPGLLEPEAAHDHEHGHDHAADGHAEFRVSLQLSCENIAALQSLGVQVFSHFPRIETLELLWVTASAQGSARLDANNPVVSLQ